VFIDDPHLQSVPYFPVAGGRERIRPDWEKRNNWTIVLPML
jgi:hypothetical protein